MFGNYGGWKIKFSGYCRGGASLMKKRKNNACPHGIGNCGRKFRNQHRIVTSLTVGHLGRREVNFQVMEQRPAEAGIAAPGAAATISKDGGFWNGSGRASDPSAPVQGSREQIGVLEAGQVVVDQPNLQALELAGQPVP